MPSIIFKSVCAVEDCGKLAYAKGYCRQHWYRLKTYGRLHKIIGLIKGNCTVENCNEPIKGLGLCKNHYQKYRLYKINLQEFHELIKNEKLGCAICGEKETSLFRNQPGKIKKLAIDHDHKTGKIRGMLCWRCNSILGRVNEDVELIDKMINYLTKHKET